MTTIFLILVFLAGMLVGAALMLGVCVLSLSGSDY